MNNLLRSFCYLENDTLKHLTSMCMSQMLEFRIQIQNEETVSTINDISETKVLRDTEVDLLFVFKVTAE